MPKPFETKKFNDKRNLNYHLKSHTIVAEHEIPNQLPNRFLFFCEVCGKRFNQRKHLNYHLKSHDIIAVTNNSENSKKCTLCNFKTPLTKEIEKHFVQTHDISTQTDALSFASVDIFEKWKWEETLIVSFSNQSARKT